MWIVILATVGLVAGLAFVLGLERQYARPVLIFAVCGVIVGALAGALRVVPAGHVGVVDFFGNVSPNSLKSGIHLVNPLARVVAMSIRTQEDKETMIVPSTEGLTVELEISALFHLAPEKAVEVYKTVGPQYVNVLFVPQFRAAARGVTGGSEAKALYTSERELMGKVIHEHLAALVKERGVVVENILLRKVALPPTVRDAIEQKLKAEQEFERMKFVNQREEMEAERKRIEAKGVRDSQAIISETLTPQYLNYLWIRNLAENSNVIYVATEANMPIFRSIDQSGPTSGSQAAR
jgi:regulator of protease activity HflC (stomatin/prohibitin superfamily)